MVENQENTVYTKRRKACDGKRGAAARCVSSNPVLRLPGPRPENSQAVTVLFPGEGWSVFTPAHSSNADVRSLRVRMTR